MWTRGVETLRKRQAEQLAAEKLGWSDPPLIGGERPDEIIRIYLYGEYLHWDMALGAEQLAAWQADPFSEAFFRIQFLQAVTPLAYMYMGFAQLLRYADRPPAFRSERVSKSAFTDGYIDVKSTSATGTGVRTMRASALPP